MLSVILTMFVVACALYAFILDKERREGRRDPKSRDIVRLMQEIERDNKKRRKK